MKLNPRNNRFYQLFVTLFKVNTRNKAAFFFTIVFPLIFIAVFGIAFQEGDPANTTISIAYINNDEGIPGNSVVLDLQNNQITGSSINTEFISILESITFEDGETKIFSLVEYSEIDIALKKIKRQNHKALLIIPDDFSLGYMAAIRTRFDDGTIEWIGYPNSDYLAEVEVIGDSSLIQYNIVTSVIQEVVRQYFGFGSIDIGASIKLTSSIESEGFTTFDFVVPGLVLFAIISNANTVAAISLSDVETDMINRLRLSKMKKWEYPTALIMSQILMSLIQVPILFASAMIFGFPFNPSMYLAFAFAIFVSIAMTGIGILLASFANNASAVGSLAAIITTPMAFLAGAFFPMPNPQLFAEGIIGDQPFGLFDLLPPTRAINALRLIMFNNYSFIDVLPDFLIAVGLASIYLTIGIFAYSRKHLRTK